MTGPLQLETGRVDLDARQLHRPDGSHTRLTPTEAALLGWLAARAGTAVPRGELLREVWGYAEGVRTRTIDTTMRRLRRKVERVPSVPRHLETVDGVGYRFVPLAELALSGAGTAVLDATVGREDQLALLDQLADSGARLLSLTGPGGIGKTRLALAWVRERAGLVVELSDLTDPEGIVDAIASAADLPPGPLPALAGQLASRGVVWLVLDNLEHLLPGATTAVAALARSPLRLLCTSRVRLGLPGETRVEVPPLSPDAGVALLRARAPSDLRLADEADLREIVARVDGMPLALELAAAHAPLLGAAGLRTRLASSLTLLHGASGPGHPDSLDEILAWSWSMLTEADRAVLGALLVFRGGIPVAAAEAVIDDPAPLACLHRLRDQSWLVPRHGPAGSPRLALLVPIRSFLRARLQPTAGAADAHARWFAQAGALAAREALELDDGSARRALAADWHNLLQAADHALAQGHGDVAAGALMAAWEAARLRHPPDALRTRIRAVLALPDDQLARDGRAQLNIALADVLRGAHSTAGAELAATDAAIAAAPTLTVRARARAMRAVVLQEHGEHEAAWAAHAEALAEAQDAGVERVIAIIHSNRGNLALRMGRLDEARENLETAATLFDTMGLGRFAAVARSNLAIVWHELGRLETAEDCYLRALRAHRALGNLRYIALIEGNLGSLELDRGALEDAEDRLQLSERLHLQVGGLRSAGIVRLNLAELARLRGDTAQATDWITASRDLADRTGSRLLAAVLDGLQAEVEAPRRPEAGRARIARAVAALDGLGARIEWAIALCRQGRIAWAQGDADTARRCRAQAETTRRENGVQQRSELGRHLAELDRALG